MMQRVDISRQPWLIAVRIALVYLIFSIIWIFLGDRLLLGLFEDPALLTRWQTAKGGLFVFFSATLIYVLMGQALQSLRREQVKVEKNLSDHNSELQRRNRVLEQFNYAISHELKTPLVTIESSLGLIQKTLPTTMEPELVSVFGYARNATRQMNQLLESLLLMFRIEKADSVKGAIEFTVLVQNVIDRQTKMNKLPGIKVTIAAEGPVLRGDRENLEQIWQHLIDNAARYMSNQEHPRIDVGFEKTGQEVLFYVRDNGIGIEKQYHAKIFGLFDQLDKNSTGNGLGLTLVQRIVEFYGGTIHVESAGDNQGSCFYFTLPDALVIKDAAP